ncbi:MAG TPA: hypothetical protein VMH28_01020 [Candidatus Acidoferrales bacterium]|nr:hypothetical protein [Candidatus Acidoferrales bacterium]
MKLLTTLFVALAMTAAAADVAGTWKASLETPNGTIQNTFVFKVDGGKLTGTVTGQAGEAPIADGKVEGDNVSFTVKRDTPNGELVLNYKGTISGDDMKMTVTIPAMDRSFDFAAKREK